MTLEWPALFYRKVKFSPLCIYKAKIFEVEDKVSGDQYKTFGNLVLHKVPTWAPATTPAKVLDLPRQMCWNEIYVTMYMYKKLGTCIS